MRTITNKPTKTGPVLLMAFGLLLIIVTLFLLPSNKSNSAPTTALIALNQITRVKLNDAKLAYDTNAAIFLDVRSQASFEMKHISGAINIPLAELEARYSELDPQRWIIPYCT